MFYLLLAICSSALVSIFMRTSETRITHNLGLLVMNYLMCSLLSAIHSGFSGVFELTTTAMGCANGVLYLVSFILLQLNIRKNGVVLSSTFMKLGLLVTMAISVCFYGEIPGLLQTVGFLLAVGAIILINYKKDAGVANAKLWLLLLLLCGGMADAMSKVFEESGVPGMDGQFLFFTFFTALLICTLLMVVKKQRIGKWEALFGLLIGIPNFYSSKFLLRALVDVAAVIAYPIYSVGSILAVTLAGILLFRERLEKRQWIALGIILAALVFLNI